MKTQKTLKVEAEKHGVIIRNDGIYTKFITADSIVVAWMAKTGGEKYTGFTNQEDVTGRKRGAKIEVMDWCLDWVVNGF